MVGAAAAAAGSEETRSGAVVERDFLAALPRGGGLPRRLGGMLAVSEDGVVDEVE